ncbi:MAG: hypothetical protein EA001_09150 [Oscillatoriales cyanobacterium]|nr:MAG: hypothetical protein EA001_09150 [Oscillatoriales cyanobacterium]
MECLLLIGRSISITRAINSNDINFDCIRIALSPTRDIPHCVNVASPSPASPQRLGFYLDDSLPPVVIASLRAYGIRVTRPTEAKLQDQSDATQLLFAYRHQLVVVTADAAFVKFAIEQKMHSGLIYSPMELPIRRVLRQLLLLYEVFQPQEFKGVIEILDWGRGIL